MFARNASCKHREIRESRVTTLQPLETRTMDEAEPKREGFRRNHPVFFWGTLALIAFFMAAAGAVAMRIPRYNAEAQEIASRMTAEQRQTHAELTADRQRRTRLALAVLERDIRVRSMETKQRHLAVVLADSVLELRQG